MPLTDAVDRYCRQMPLTADDRFFKKKSVENRHVIRIKR
jgi:hypothetical protein